MSGREVLIQIKKNYKWSQLPIIIYATTIHPPDADSYKMLGAQDVLKKHVTFQDLCAALQVVLKKVSVSL
jgi:CheY-like chemotaxis protein